MYNFKDFTKKTSCLVVKGQAKINTSIQLKLKVVVGVYVIFLANAELA